MNKEHVNSIKTFIEKTQRNFPEMSFRCEFKLFSNLYIIDVQPSSIFNENNQYAEWQYDFREKFEDAYPGYTLLFLSNDELFKVEKPIFEIGPKRIITKSRKRPYVIPEYEPSYV
ncbi:MAG: hypothetical protein LBO74_04340 [Candidatus Symbiothrix sp.]|jgi:hypothetical protein|nr:hypothetical protein [Candidatus Symbiothrix sp.]